MTAVRSRRNAIAKQIARPGLPQERRSSVYLARQQGAAEDVRPAHQNDNVATLALRHGRYEVHGSFFMRNTDGARVVNKLITVVDGWIDESVFYPSHVRTIERLRGLWRCIKRPTHPYFDSHDPENREDGEDAERAKNLLRNCRRLVGHYRWNVFENVCRWNEPTGIPGSRIASVSPQSIAAAQQIVREVAEEMRAIL